MIFPSWTLKSLKNTFGMVYDQRVIIKFLYNEGADGRDIATTLQANSAEHAYQLRTVQFWITEIRLGRQDLHDELRTGRPLLDDLDAKILVFLHKSPFESAHSIAQRLLVSHQVVLRHLHDYISFKSFHLHCVPHMLANNLCEKRKEHTIARLPFLHAVKRDGWHHLLTGDESWFFFNTSPRRVWTLSKDDVVTKPRHDIESQKFMFTIIWNLSSFYIFDRLPNDFKMNSISFVINLLIPLE
jgi:hypothetical protein